MSSSSLSPSSAQTSSLITNEKVVEFYNEHPQINLNDVNKNFVSLLSNLTKDAKNEEESINIINNFVQYTTGNNYENYKNLATQQ